jgi:hypothetical protein
MDEGQMWRKGGDQGGGGDPGRAPGWAAGPAQRTAAARAPRLRPGGRPGGWRPTGRRAAPRRGAPEGARARPGVCLARRGPGPGAAPKREPARRGTRGGDGQRRRTPGLRGADPQPRGGG